MDVPVPDIERTDLLVVMGANPSASQGSLLAAPDVVGIIDGIRKRGKVIVVDPVRTATAARADEWLPITPGTDAALLLAVAHTLFAENLVSLGDLGPHIDGLDRMREVAAEWSPERVAGVTGVEAERIRALTRELAGAERAVVYGRIGLCNQEFGSLASWLVDVINILTGHFDVPGGSMFPRATAWSVTVQPIPGLENGAPEFGRFYTRVRGAKEVLGQVPVSCLAEEIATPGEGQIRALITVAGNPVLSTPAGHKLDEVLPTLEAMIAVDLWLNETTRHADVLLPGASPLEQPHHDDLILNFAINSVANYSQPVFEPDDVDRPQEWEILDQADRIVQRHTGGGCRRRGDRRWVLRLHGLYPGSRRGADPHALRPRRARAHSGPHAAYRVRFGDRYGENPDGLTLDKLKAHPNGINFGQMVPRVPDVLGTADRKIRLAPRYLLDDLPRLAERLDRAPDELVLVEQTASAVQQLVAAQRRAADEGQGSLHAAHASRRRGQAAIGDGRPRHGYLRGRAHRGACRGDRRDHAGRGVDAAWLGTWKAGHPHVCRQ